MLDPFGPDVPQAVQDAVTKLKDAVVAGDKAVFTGPIVKQDGTVVVPEGETR